jgi:uncharacterized protein YjfI (DUF2170 family)
VIGNQGNDQADGEADQGEEDPLFSSPLGEVEESSSSQRGDDSSCEESDHRHGYLDEFESNEDQWQGKDDHDHGDWPLVLEENNELVVVSSTSAVGTVADDDGFVSLVIIDDSILWVDNVGIGGWAGDDPFCLIRRTSGEISLESSALNIVGVLLILILCGCDSELDIVAKKRLENWVAKVRCGWSSTCWGCSCGDHNVTVWVGFIVEITT